MPECYGPWKTAHERLRLWTADGTWDKSLAEVIVRDDAVGEVECHQERGQQPDGFQIRLDRPC